MKQTIMSKKGNRIQKNKSKNKRNTSLLSNIAAEKYFIIGHMEMKNFIDLIRQE